MYFFQCQWYWYIKWGHREAQWSKLIYCFSVLPLPVPCLGQLAPPYRVSEGHWRKKGSFSGSFLYLEACGTKPWTAAPRLECGFPVHHAHWQISSKFCSVAPLKADSPSPTSVVLQWTSLPCRTCPIFSNEEQIPAFERWEVGPSSRLVPPPGAVLPYSVFRTHRNQSLIGFIKLSLLNCVVSVSKPHLD